MDLLYFLKVLLRKKWLIIGLTLLAMITAFTLKLFQRPLYESKAQYSTGFTIDRVKIAEGSAVADLYAADTKFDNVIETFKSPRVIGMISYRLLLHDLENPGGRWHNLSEKEKENKIYKDVKVDTVIKILNEKVSSNELLRSDIPRERNILEFLKLYKYDYYSLLEHLIIVRVNKTDYLDIVYRSENPYLSAWVVNAMGNEFLNYYKNLNYQRTNENISNIRDLERQQQQKIDSLNGRLLSEKVSQGSIDPASLSASAMETVKDLEGKLADVKNTYDLNVGRISYLTQELNSAKNRAGTNNTSNEELLDLIDQKNKLEAQLIAKGGTDAYIEQQLKTLRTKINSRSSGGLNNKMTDKISGLQNQINEATALKNAAEATMNDYNSRIAYYKGLTRINPGSGVKMEVIKSQLDIEQKQLANLKEKLNQAEGLSKDDPTSNFTQTLVGQPAVEPEPKKTITTIGISGMSMFFLTCFTLLFIEVFNATIKTPFNFEKNVKFPLKGIVNNIRLKKGLLAEILLNEDRKNDSNAYQFKNNIRKLRFEIINSAQKVFLFTSTSSGTGKSLILEAVALSMVLIRKKVLIIDLNLHNNTLTNRFQAEFTIQQLNEKFNSNLPLRNQNFSTKTSTENINIIGCDQTSATPSEVLSRVDFQNFINQLKEQFDYIFIESSALNKYSDSKELMKYSDKIITIFSAEQIYSQTDKGSLNYIRDQKDKSLGAVLNKVFTENMNY